MNAPETIILPADPSAPDGQRTAVPLGKRVRRLVMQLGPSRMAATIVFLLAAILIARFSWQMPLINAAERALYDARATLMAPKVEQDSRITLVTYNDETLFNTGIRSPLDRTLLANALGNLDLMGAKAIGIDIAFDSPRPDDDVLKAQLRSMRTPTWLAYAEQASNPNTIFYEQQKFLEAFIADVTTTKTRPTSVLFRTDGDDVIREWPHRPANLPPLMANALAPVDPAYADFQGGIRFLVPARAAAGQEEPVFANIPIDTFAMPMDADMRAGFAELVKDRYVLIGGDIIDNDQFNTPLSRFPDAITGQHETMIGLEVHAHMLAQQLDGAWPRPIPVPALWALAVLIVIAGGLTSLIDLRARWVALAFLGQMAFFVAFPFWLHARGIDTTTLPTFGWAVGWLFGYAAVGTAARTIGSRQRAFAQSALGKYLPADVAAQILRDPDQLSLHGERRNIFCVFTDLEGFTKLSHAVTPETVARLLNEYLDRLSDIVLDHGGTIDKFVGDAVVAFWGAPLSRPDDGERAAAAALAMFEAGEKFRTDLAADDVPPIGMTRVGLHVGDAIVGNFGGEGRIQYTALGDSMNTASRLEAANKSLKTGVLISAEAAARSGRDDLVPMGRVTLRGRAQPVDVLTPRPDLVPERRAQIAALVAAHAAGDKNTHVTTATALAAEFAQDASILFLIERLNETENGESYVLS
ncbi:adenylate/guanylate cyclase domain-containing protein [Sphingopyxis sp. SE2]|jgi:adenylate cyclase|uniref:adenylate/guanylate cyclase domain-containing protein n=1 Tax=unclassified Sphingopyxis TaxID=2614943 RepID=UPI00050EF093|nr:MULTISPECIES: adenylate/guanylate cyclase domain-containing protein [unclassified Sphingopyxis]KGB57754.1 Adenylate/guanylate cyclase precursor [Sphingopyxis sp. LC363]MDT7528961.1 adenylate/guanylate cyclase domain-containing protein [Sphingopyxis sp. SE2]